MAKRSIADEETDLIKAMLARNTKNKDIQFFFNRPGRPVNSGRITQIRSGNYGPSKDIEPSSDSDLEAFIGAHSNTPGVAAVAIPASAVEADVDPFSDVAIKGGDKRWRLAGDKTDFHECKTNFGPLSRPFSSCGLATTF